MAGIRRPLTLVITGLALLAAPGSAAGALVTNGDFETGSLSGWQTSNEGPGNWFAYTGTVTPLNMVPVTAPPQGAFAAITDQSGISREFLYQDVALPPAGSGVQLRLIRYHTSDDPIVSPDSLNIGIVNQQYRIDVMRPGAAIDSVAAGDVLANIFRTPTGGAISSGPTPTTFDLSPFAGQTVRLRFAVVTTEDNLHAGADGVAISGVTVGKAKLNKGNGTAKLPVTVTDPGTVTLSGKGVKGISASRSVTVRAGGKVKLLVKAKGKTKSRLSDSGKAKVKVNVTYTPSGGTPISDTAKVKLKES